MRTSTDSLQPFEQLGFELLNFLLACSLQLAFAYLEPNGQQLQPIRLSEVLIDSSAARLPFACFLFSSYRPPFASVSLH